eukprot:4961-Heterococcus_DN1.PRE.1
MFVPRLLNYLDSALDSVTGRYQETERDADATEPSATASAAVLTPEEQAAAREKAKKEAWSKAHALAAKREQQRPPVPVESYPTGSTAQDAVGSRLVESSAG